MGDRRLIRELNIPTVIQQPPSDETRQKFLDAASELYAALEALRAAEERVSRAKYELADAHDLYVSWEQRWQEYVATAEPFSNARLLLSPSERRGSDD